jgi:hypothetical protein
MLFFGIEIEAVGPFHHDCLTGKLLDKGYSARVEYSPNALSPLGMWGVGWDSTLNQKWNEYPVELRSPVLSEKRIDTIIPIIKILKELKYRTTATCGLHVHVSSSSHVVNPKKVCEQGTLLKLDRVTRHQRTRWAEWRLNRSEQHDEHYAAVNILEGSRIEVRVFNGALNVRHICRAIRLSMELFNRCVA